MENERLIFSPNDLIEKRYRIYKGDCIEILKKIPKKSIDLVFADPPYNLQLKNELYRPNQTKVAGVDDEWDKFNSFEEYDKFTEEWLIACREVMKNDATIWVIGSYHNIFRVGKIMMDLGFWILNDIQWYKTNPMPNFRGVRFTNATETLIWAKKSEKSKYTFNYNVMKELNGGKQMTSVWRIPICSGKERIKDENGKKAHSTQKPEELLKRVILSSSKEGDLILDPFCGSGTTCAVAKKLNRRAIGIERELKYVEISKERLSRINTENYRHLQLKEPEKKTLKRVSMEELVKKGYFKIGDEIFTKNKKHIATILENGYVKNGVSTGSIHKIGSLVKGNESCNGWKFWYYNDNGKIKLIDEKRKEYRTSNGI